MDVWEQRELELAQKHAEILQIREAILRGTERYYDAQNARSSSFITDYKKAKERNTRLLSDIARVTQVLNSAVDNKGSGQKHFSTLRANYWGMVRNIFPVWLEEQKLYEQKHGIPLSSRNLPQDPNLPRPSPRSGRRSPQTPRSARSPQTSLTVPVSPRPGSRTETRASNGGDTTRTIPPLDLDFSMGEDLTISQASGLKATQESTMATPKSALSASGKLKNTGTKKSVSIKEDAKKVKEREKKERERERKEAEKRRKAEEKERKAAEKAAKKSAKTPRSDRSTKSNK